MQTSTLIVVLFSLLTSATLAFLERQLLPAPGPADAAAAAAVQPLPALEERDALGVAEALNPALHWQTRRQRPLYEQPDLRLPPLQLLLAPRQVQVTRLDGAWAQVRLADGSRGWMLREDLRAAPLRLLGEPGALLARWAAAS